MLKARKSSGSKIRRMYRNIKSPSQVKSYDRLQSYDKSDLLQFTGASECLLLGCM